MTVAFVFSGGASLGSIQVGMVQALADAGITADIMLGTSVGAMNAAFLAGGGTPDELADVWRGIRRSQMFPLRPLVGLRAFLGRRISFVPNTGIERLLEKQLLFDRIEEAKIPLTIVASDAYTGAEVLLRNGPVVPAVMASTALPGIFPPVQVGSRLLIDGGIANNTPISTAIAAGATEVWVLTTGYSCTPAEVPATPFGLALHAVGLLVQQRLQIESGRSTYPVPVNFCPPPCPIEVGPTDFSQTAELIDVARHGTAQWLSNGMPDAMPLIATNPSLYVNT